MVFGVVRIRRRLLPAIRIANEIAVGIVGVGLRVAVWINDLRDAACAVSCKGDALPGGVDNPTRAQGQRIAVGIAKAVDSGSLVYHIDRACGGGETEGAGIVNIRITMIDKLDGPGMLPCTATSTSVDVVDSRVACVPGSGVKVKCVAEIGAACWQ